jgi:cell division protein FtsW (lipid II flippase)
MSKREARLWWLALGLIAILALALAIAPSARLGAWGSFRFSHFVIIPAWAAVAWLARRVADRHLVHRDPILLPVTFSLIGVGLLTIWRISPLWGARQTAWFLVSSVLLLEVIRAPRNLSWLYRYRYVWLSVGLLLTAMTLILGTNPAGGDARLWLGCCGVYFQPSEALRFLLLVYLASYLADRLTLGRSQLLSKPLAAFAPIAVAWGLSAALLIVQRDLGAGMLLLGSLAIMLYVATGKTIVLLGSAGIGIAGGLLAYRVVDLIQVRLQTWVNPHADPIGSGYQSIQSMIAFASGGMLGSGPGMGSPEMVPVSHSDFIFAALGEEWGLLGSLGFLALIGIVVSRGIRASATAKTPFRALLAAGISFGIALQSILIIGGVTRLLPLTGVTLPFISYGGTSLVTSTVGLAILLIISNDSWQTPWIEVERVQSLFALVWIALGLMLGWWSIVRAPELVSRTDNPRRAIEQRVSLRGRILDRNGIVLAESIGEPGEYRRTYPLGSAASVIGYDSSQFGQSGLELAMDPYLRGDLGHEPYQVAWTRLLKSSPPSGVDVFLTLDAELQERAAQALAEKRGGIIIFEAGTGEILVMASSPTYDPNLLTDNWTQLIHDEDAPFMIRPTQGKYQPGMVLAPFIFAWAEELQINLPTDIFNPPELLGYSWECAQEFSNLDQALRAVCPKVFGALGEHIGTSELKNLITVFALDRRPQTRLESSLDLPPARLDSPSALEAVGQGYLTVSPLMLARSFALLTYPLEQPGIHIVNSAGSEKVPARNPAMQPVSARMQNVVWEALALSDPDWIEYAAEAFLGEGKEGVAWYLAASGEGQVIVIILEGNSREQALEFGRSFLDLNSGGS